VKIHVLVADDHAVVRDGLRLLLETQVDIDVVGQAADGREAVRQSLRLRPDFVIMDIAMPGLNGIEAARQILGGLPFCKIIVLSMYSSKEHIVRALKAGVKGYVLKESAGSEVIKAIRAVQGGRRYMSEKIEAQVVDGLEAEEHNDGKGLLEKLSAREREILQLVVEGKSSAEIGKILFLSPKTVETYRSRLMSKLDVSDLPGLVKLAIHEGLIFLE